MKWGDAGDGEACGGEYGRGGSCCGCAMICVLSVSCLHSWLGCRRNARRPPRASTHASKRVHPVAESTHFKFF